MNAVCNVMVSGSRIKTLRLEQNLLELSKPFLTALRDNGVSSQLNITSLHDVFSVRLVSVGGRDGGE
jgi:hypothetical protein